MNECPYCHASVPEGKTTCPACGKKLSRGVRPALYSALALLFSILGAVWECQVFLLGRLPDADAFLVGVLSLVGVLITLPGLIFALVTRHRDDATGGDRTRALAGIIVTTVVFTAFMVLVTLGLYTNITR